MKTIKLSKNECCFIDDVDYEEVSKYNWFYGSGYAFRTQKRKTIYMHREITKAGSDEQVDHINGNKLDNQRSNLRICTPSENRRNRGKQKNNTSGYKGVFFEKRYDKWYAKLENKFLGYFDSPEDAAKAYDKYALEAHGIFANLNFRETQ